MATLVLSLAGAAIGAKVGGAVLGLSGMVIGRAIGATLGRVIDQRLLGRGSSAVDSGRIDRLRVTGAGAGVPLTRVWGRARVAGHVIWAADFQEQRSAARRSKSKGGPRPAEAPRYTVSLAIALCEGEISGIGRIWADGVEIGRDQLNLRLHRGTADQQPDPVIAAIEGIGNTPAYRGTAYVVLEDLDLSPWGNRIPNLNFEVLRPAVAPGILTQQEAVTGVAWMPGSGEYALATSPVSISAGSLIPGLVSQESVTANRNAPGSETDFEASLRSLEAELPRARSSLLVVSWFGSDLRAADCVIEPKVEFADREGSAQPWAVAGRTRADAPEVARIAPDTPVYGGTPSDASVIEAIRALRAAGQHVVVYPFILMEQLAGNDLPDPWTGGTGQPPLPWRGRITLDRAPGQPGSADGTAAAAAEVAAFFGTAQPGDFTPGEGTVTYSGPDEWRYRRFILHYAALCAAAGGVDAFCIGSEMVALNAIRGPANSFPAVAQMVQLLQDVRAILGPGTTLTYAADWSEYWGWQDGQGARMFHLDPLWAHPDCDVVAIDNYMPLSDWRDGAGHLDAGAGTIQSLDYLAANVAGGEGYDWFYASDLDREKQIRTPITDGAGGEPWIFRYKDLRSWWGLLHYDRPEGVRATQPTAWQPGSKPVWFTEYGCAAIDKGTNQPNKFLDPKSSESFIPHFSTGRRDELMQMQYVRAMAGYWTDPANNPASDVYAGRMVDWGRAHYWAWDARPWPWFPGNRTLWADADNWARGHWITGRATNQPLAAVVAEICLSAGLGAGDIDVSALHGLVRGYTVPSTASPRAALQPLLLAHGIEALERDGLLVFRLRDGEAVQSLDPGALVAREGGAVEVVRAARAETVGRVRLVHVDAEGGFESRSAEAVIPDEDGTEVAETELPLVLRPAEARSATRRWLAEARIARDVARFALPPSTDLGAGDVVALPAPDGTRLWRIDRMDLAGAREVEAVRVEPGAYRTGLETDDPPEAQVWRGPAAVTAVLLDLPLIRGDEVPHQPLLAATAVSWPGPVAAWQAAVAAGEFELAGLVTQPAAIGVTETALPLAQAGRWQRGEGLRLRMLTGVELVSQAEAEVLDGANLLALGNGADWELIQFAGAELVGPRQWQLTGLLRGQFGTEFLRPTVWAPGTLAVLVDRALRPMDLPAALRGQSRRWRIGPAALASDDPALAERVVAVQGAGLRPWAPVHLRARRLAPALTIEASWVRRSRSGGDPWEVYEVPLAEEAERYRLRVFDGATPRREVVLAEPRWTYTAAQQAQDGIAGPITLRVAQISAAWGPGPEAVLEVPG